MSLAIPTVHVASARWLELKRPRPNLSRTGWSRFPKATYHLQPIWRG